jgi:hydroxyethylthiazole kinase-like uncharacterized protein yjeF
MQNLYDEVSTLDKRCYEEFGLSEDILMENAASKMAEYIKNNFSKGSSIIVVAGSGNNGADGITLARILHKEYDIEIFYAKKPSSTMAILQNKRAKLIGVRECKKLKNCDILVDAIVGTGFKGEFSKDILTIVDTMNSLKAFKIACDVPSAYMFYADITFTMGGLKKGMFLDYVKDFIGEIVVADLGISRLVYEKDSNTKLLSYLDMKLPKREKKDTHKGSFGHLNIISGNKKGAGVIAAKSALKFGVGIVTLISKKQNLNLDYSIMSDTKISSNVTAIAFGMGFGDDKKRAKAILKQDVCMVLDADIFHMKIVKKFLKKRDIVLTPHPKEFVSLLKLTKLADIGVRELQNNRFEYVEMFCKEYPDVVLLLKGANVIIAKGKNIYVNAYGTQKLAKGGSGDVLAGLIASLLAQAYSPLDATITASLAHTKLAQNYTLSDFSLTPADLIEGIGNL